MKKSALFVLSNLISFLLFSQQKIFTYSHPDLPGNQSYSTSILSRENDGFLLSLVNKWSIKRILVNKDGRSVNLLQQFTSFSDSSSDFKYKAVLPKDMATSYQKNSFVGGAHSNGKIMEVLRSKFSYDFIFIETDLKTGEILSTDTIKSSFSEKIISSFEKDNGLFLLTYIKNTNDLVVYEKKSQNELKKTKLTIDIAGFGKISNRLFASNINEFSDIFKSHDFAVYENNLRYPSLFTSIRNKAYIHKDKVIFTVSSNRLNTYLVSVNLNNTTYTIKSFDQDEASTNNSSQATTSSFLIDSLLITCHAREKTLHLNIFNILSEKLIKSIKINEQTISSVADGPISKTGSFFSKSDLSHENFAKFYKTAVINELSISGYSDQGNLYLSFAAPYKQFTASALLSIVASMAGTYFINSSPDTYGYLLTVFHDVKTPTFVGFNTTLDLKDHKLIPQSPNFTVWDKISSFINTQQLKLSDCLFFHLNNHYYIGYFFPQTKRYMIYRFSENGITE